MQSIGMLFQIGYWTRAGNNVTYKPEVLVIMGDEIEAKVYLNLNSAVFDLQLPISQFIHQIHKDGSEILFFN